MRLERIARVALVLATLLALSLSALAQEHSPKADVFLGYSASKLDTTGYGPPLPAGGVAGVDFYIGRHFGLTGDFTYEHAKKFDLTHRTFMVGPKFVWRGQNAMPFVEALVGGGGVRHGVYGSTGLAAGFGGGIDLPVFKHFGLRLIRVDDILQHLKDGTDNSLRFQTGITFNFGEMNPAPKRVPAAACSATPTEVMAGEPVTATASAEQFNPKHTLTYSWTASGGKTSGNATSTQIDTAGMAPGTYRVSAHVTDGKKEMADCTANFTIKEPPKHPPTITCSVDRATVESGQPAAISCQGNSEDRRPLTYSWQSSCGTVAGNGQNGTLNTNGVTGPCTITTTVTDDRGLSANTTTNVTVQAPPPPPPPPAPEPGSVGAIREDLAQKGKALLNVHFDTAKATIRPESEPLLTNAAEVLKEDPSLYIYVDGYTDNRGGKAMNMALSRRRAASVKTWLEKHGVEAKRMDARGFGMENPVGDNNTEAGRQANRRVELVKMTDAEKDKAMKTPARPVRKAVKKAAPKK